MPSAHLNTPAAGPSCKLLILARLAPSCLETWSQRRTSNFLPVSSCLSLRRRILLWGLNPSRKRESQPGQGVNSTSTSICNQDRWPALRRGFELERQVAINAGSGVVCTLTICLFDVFGKWSSKCWESEFSLLGYKWGRWLENGEYPHREVRRVIFFPRLE